MLKRVMPHELDVEQIDYYYKAIDTDEHSGDVELISRGVYDNHLQLWTWTTDESSMVIITQVKLFPDGFKQLFVSMLAGKGGITDWSECTSAFSGDPCLDLGCMEVVAFVKYNLWNKFKEYQGVGDGVDERYVVIGKDAVHVKEH